MNRSVQNTLELAKNETKEIWKQQNTKREKHKERYLENKRTQRDGKEELCGKDREKRHFSRLSQLFVEYHIFTTDNSFGTCTLIFIYYANNIIVRVRFELSSILIHFQLS